MGFARAAGSSKRSKSASSASNFKQQNRAQATNRAPLAGMFTPKSHSLASMAKTASSRDKKRPNRQGFARGMLNRRG